MYGPMYGLCYHTVVVTKVYHVHRLALVGDASLHSSPKETKSTDITATFPEPAALCSYLNETKQLQAGQAAGRSILLIGATQAVAPGAILSPRAIQEHIGPKILAKVMAQEANGQGWSRVELWVLRGPMHDTL